MEAKKNQKESSGKGLNGTEQPSNWEKAAELIAGDNQLMAWMLKLLLTPLTLIAGAGLIAYLFFKNRLLKEEMTKLRLKINSILKAISGEPTKVQRVMSERNLTGC